MDDAQRDELIRMGWTIHGVVEEHYRNHPATKGSENVGEAWLDKQRLLLADMAVHLLQTAMAPGPVALSNLQNNLHAILTIADQFLPHAELKKARESIYNLPSPTNGLEQAIAPS